MPSYFYAYFLLAFSTLQHGQCRVLLLDSKIVLNLELIGSRLCPSSAKTTRLPRRESLLIHMLLVSALPASSYAADIGYLVDGTPMDAAGNNAVH